MPTLLQVDNISVAFDGFKAINGLSFDIGHAELRAIIGPNGAGKTTFMDIVTGKTRPDTGDVRCWNDCIRKGGHCDAAEGPCKNTIDRCC